MVGGAVPLRSTTGITFPTPPPVGIEPGVSLASPAAADLPPQGVNHSVRRLRIMSMSQTHAFIGKVAVDEVTERSYNVTHEI